MQITLTPCPQEPPVEGAGAQTPPPSDPATCGTARVKLTSGDQAGRSVTAQLPSGPGAQRFTTGDDIVLTYLPGDTLEASPYQISDHDRSFPLLLAGVAFALAVIAFGRWRGLSALVGLAITFVLLLMFLIPAILAGEPPLLVAIVGASAIMLAVLYLTHGFTVTTSIAIIGTTVSLALTGLLSYLAIGLVRLNGITDESSFYLDTGYQINTQGLLLASIIIGTLGVLDDVTVTQAVTVAELARANPAYGFARLYRAAARIGRAHIASVINTIVLAYAGASLPLLLLISVGREPIGQVVTNPVLAQEIVRSIVGTLGLIASVPITTALAAAATRRTTTPTADRPPSRARHRRRGDRTDEPPFPKPAHAHAHADAFAAHDHPAATGPRPSPAPPLPVRRTRTRPTEDRNGHHPHPW
ncbi:YibE/F family protein [Thermocatellispora tengchongensis]|uniref:YibE/F family protein n=1 Tax=Thermocatellispora tengchongensis TaxID=1073253 RepID=UPI0036308255